MLDNHVQDSIRVSAAEAFQHMANTFNNYATDAILQYVRPSVLMRPKLYRDGNAWFALYGENIVFGVVGCGDSPELAMLDFDRTWGRKVDTAAPSDRDVSAPLGSSDSDGVTHGASGKGEGK